MSLFLKCKVTFIVFKINCVDRPQAYKKTLNIANQNHNEIITSHPSGWLLPKRKKKKKGMYWRQYREIRSLTHCWWECKMVQPLWKTICQFLKKLNRITIWSSNSTSGYISKRISNRVSKKHLYTPLQSSNRKSRKMETTQMFING